MTERLEQELRPFLKRARLLIAGRAALRGGIVGAGVSAVIAIVSGWMIELANLWLYAGLILAGVVVGAAWSLRRRPGELLIARIIDDRLGLKDRVGSAVSAEPDEAMAPALAEDAATHISGSRPRDVLRTRLKREIGILAALCLVTAGFFFAPTVSLLQSKQKRAEVRVIKSQGKKLVAIAKEIRKKELPPDERRIARQVARNMERLGRKMETGRVPKKRALIALNKQQEELRQAQRRMAGNITKSPPRVARDLRALAAKMESQQRSSTGLRPPSRQSGKGPQVQLPPELLKKLAELMQKGDFQRAMDMIDQLAANLNSQSLSPDELKQLQQALADMAKILQNSDLDKLAKEMLKAAEALRNMDPKLAAQCLKSGCAKAGG